MTSSGSTNAGPSRSVPEGWIAKSSLFILYSLHGQGTEETSRRDRKETKHHSTLEISVGIALLLIHIVEVHSPGVWCW